VRRVRVIGPLAVLGGLLYAIAYLGLHRDLLEHPLPEIELLRFGRLAPILFVLVCAVATTLFTPGSIVTIAGGAMFGPMWGRFGIFRERPWGKSGLSDRPICRFGLGFKNRRRRAGSPDASSGARRMERNARPARCSQC
jgi:hypothetical protein